jgi:hypothetical protein
MVSAIGATPSPAPAHSSYSSQIAALERQLAAYQKELASAEKGGSTPAALVQMAAIDQQIAMTQSEIVQLQSAAAQSTLAPSAPPNSSSSAASSESGRKDASDVAVATPASSQAGAVSAVGDRTPKVDESGKASAGAAHNGPLGHHIDTTA